MIELFPEGFEEIEHGDGVELVAYTDSGGEERLWQAFGHASGREVDGGWENGWRAFHQPVEVAGLWIGPSWREAPRDAIAVVIDPGRAFGTGSHPTTRLALELLAKLERGSLLDVALQGGHRHGCTKRGLRQGEVDGAVDVVSFTYETLVRSDVHLDVHIPGGAADRACVTFAAEPDALPVVDARGDVDIQRSLLEHPAGAVALLAWMLDVPAGAAAGRTGLRAHELAEDAARHLAQTAASAAAWTGADLRPRLGAAAVAARASDGDLERHLARRPARGLDEVDLHSGGDVCAAATAGAPGDPEEVVSEERSEQIGQIADIERRRPEAAAPQTGVTEAIVKLAPLGVRQHLVRLDDLAEALFGVRLLRDVGMELSCVPAKRTLDLVWTRVARDSEQLVIVVLGGGHYGTACGAVVRTYGLCPCVRRN